jgi:hypothetical protein
MGFPSRGENRLSGWHRDRGPQPFDAAALEVLRAAAGAPAAGGP